MIRISTANAFNDSIATLQRRQSDMSDAQAQLTSGKRVLRASDDPTAAARAERARALMQRTEGTQRAIDASRNAMTLTESALADAGDLLQEARDLMVSAGNASYTDAERNDIANQLMAIRNQLLGVANRSDGSGGYVFAGQGASQPPFMDDIGGVRYVGVGGEVRVASAEPLPLTLDGNSIWLGAQSGNGVFVTGTDPAHASTSAWIDSGRVTDPSLYDGSSYTIEFAEVGGAMTYSIFKDGVATGVADVPFVDGQAIEIDGLAVQIAGAPAAGDVFTLEPAAPELSVFGVIDDVVNALKTPNQTNSQITQIVQSGVRDVDALRNNLQSARSMTGELLNRIDGVEQRNADLSLFAESTRSAAEDLDMVQAISNFQNQQIGYQAALQTYASMQRMSLFDYIQG